jgi:hypothetical protein
MSEPTRAEIMQRAATGEISLAERVAAAEIQRLTAQRDALLTAAEAVLANLDDADESGREDEDNDYADVANLRAAIATVREGVKDA